ncbi:hypothetical protein, partial [Streptomyces galilaeus]|uniref:hypothetical protein n=1 Tax=Streptomyces galilaeus TaxID=33899 RepID=UPI0038F81C75
KAFAADLRVISQACKDWSSGLGLLWNNNGFFQCENFGLPASFYLLLNVPYNKCHEVSQEVSFSW